MKGFGKHTDMSDREVALAADALVVVVNFDTV